MKLTIHGYNHKIENKYYDWYNSIVISRINNPIDKNMKYAEMHHILPRSLGGNNDKNNLILLLPREHYICHCLLTKFILGNGYYKMLTAFMSMNMKSQYTSERYMNSRLYNYIKVKYAEEFSNVMKNRWNDQEYKSKTTLAIKDSWYNGLRDQQLAHMKENSPFKNPEIHKKTIEKRTKNGTNVWVTNNPMKDPDKAKEIAKSRSGKNHYLTKTRLYYYKNENDYEWQLLDPELTISQICKKYNWSIATFNYILGGKIPKRGPMKGIMLKKVILK